MTTDLRPATSALAGLVRGVRDDQLATVTPCGGITVGELLDHIDNLSLAFAAAGTRQYLADGGAPRSPDASRLGTDWRDRLPAQLDGLAAAWQPAAAWDGATKVGGGEMPAVVAGSAGLNEVIVHGWDLAVATGQSYPADDPSLGAAISTAYGWASSVAAQNPGGTPGLFGPPVDVPADAPVFDRLLGATGRQPSWRQNA
jgi:uncharacterized protein (TIGR03086 family)